MANLFNWFKRKNHSDDPDILIPNVNNLVSPVPKETFIDFLLDRGEIRLAYYVLNRYYLTVSPLADAIDMLACHSARIDPSVWDFSSKEFDPTHPLLTLLRNPNPLETYEEFMERGVSLFLLHGEIFLLTTGKISDEPHEIFVVSAQHVNIDFHDTDGFIRTIRVLEEGRSEITFHREDVNGRFRFYETRPHGQQEVPHNEIRREITQVRHFNPRGSLIPIRGRSIIQSLYYEIEQWLASNKHNLSVLLRGATLSGFLTTDENFGVLTSDQRSALVQELDNYISGAENAGRIAMVDCGLKFQSITQSNKDMDFRELKKDLKTDIYNRLGIPLPLVNPETMTMANRESAQVGFFENAIMPLISRMFASITWATMYRYPDSDTKAMKVDESNVQVLEPKKIEKVSKLFSGGIITVNEARVALNIEEFTDGGNAVYRSSTEVPVAGEFEVAAVDEDSDQNSKEKDRVKRDVFINIMQSQHDKHGKRKFTDDAITTIADEEKLK